MRSTFSILFYINRKKAKQNLAPVMGRITINGTTAYFSCKCSIDPQLWNTRQNCAIGKSQQAQLVNKYISTYRSAIVQSYQKILITRNFITAQQVKQDFLGTGNDYTTLLKFMQEDIDQFSLRIGRDRSCTTLKKMQTVLAHTAAYIKHKYNTPDIYLIEITPKFITTFANWLQNSLSLKQSTIWVYTTYLKKVITRAYQSGKIPSNPFQNFRISPNVKEREFLTEEELLHLNKHNFSNKEHQKVRDLYIFSCLTGMSYIDIKNLKPENIHTIKGEIWVVSRRKKTNQPFQIKLIEIARNILYKYMCLNADSNRTIFDIKSYEWLNNNLKKLMQECGLGKHLTFHTARHTFATIALTNNMPIESISKILGHSNITTTQIYAKIINRKLSQDITQLEKELSRVLSPAAL